MRTELAKYNGQKITVTATFEKYRWKKFRGVYVSRTLLLKDVKDAKGNILTDHLWFKVGKKFAKLELKAGDIVSFTARVDSYRKGYIRRDEEGYLWQSQENFDYHLEYPQRLTKLQDWQWDWQ